MLSIHTHFKPLPPLRVPPHVLVWSFILFLTIHDSCPVSALGPQEKHNWTPELTRIAKVDPVIETALELIMVPSPSGYEKELANLILRKLRGIGLPARRDNYGNIIAKIPASPGYKDVPSILLAAHMDMVVGDKKNPFKPIKPIISKIDGTEWITSDGTTTLGADDKAGIATIIDVIARLLGKHSKQTTPIKHGPIEIAFTREEETTAKGAKGLDTNQFQSKLALILDGENLFEVIWQLAGTTGVTIRIHGGRGGHSGTDIDRPDNINAIKVMSEIDVLIPQGVIEKNETGIISSINAGLTEGGTAANVIAPEARIVYLIRSANPVSERKLLEKIRAIVLGMEQKYQALQASLKIDLLIDQSLPPWSGNTDSSLFKLIQKAADRLAGRKIYPKSVHAGAEANIYANKKNSKSETLQPLLIGIANLHAIHTTRERMDWKSLMTGRDWMLEIVQLLAQEANQ